jgi:small subunit ribosomal protein S9
MTVAKEKVIKTAKETKTTKMEIVTGSNIDSLGRAYSTGKRKNAVAKVWIKKGTGIITINGKDGKLYIKREILFTIIHHPFAVVKQQNSFDVEATIVGGGKSGQAGALAHGISKALSLYDSSNRPLLKEAGLITRDSRVVERKKYGLKKARKAQTYRKR